MVETDVVVIGAGPYGLAATAHLRRAGIDATNFGPPMSFWQTMPRGMFLRSNWEASNMVEPEGDYSLSAFTRATGTKIDKPIPLDRFVDYGKWVQEQAVPDVDKRTVSTVERSDATFRVTLEDGECLSTQRVVVACGINPFAWSPPEFAPLSRDLVSHTSEHTDPRRFTGTRVGVVGGGQSALEWAAMLHETGASVEVFARAPRLAWIRGMKRHLGPLGPVVYAPTDVGPLGYSRLVAQPDLFRRLPRPAQDRIARRCIRPAGAGWLVSRLRKVPIRTGVALKRTAPTGAGLDLELTDGSHRQVDHLLLGTGYRIDIRRYPFLNSALLDHVETFNGYPILGKGLESSVPGLHFMGAPAAWSFGPIMRFVSGSWYSACALTEHVAFGRMGERPNRSREALANLAAP
jgi:FAD-dependent urate hydroxylase